MVQTQRTTGLWTIDIDSSLRGVQNPRPVLQLDIDWLAAKVEVLRIFWWLRSSKSHYVPGLPQVLRKLSQETAIWFWVLSLLGTTGAAYEETADANKAPNSSCSQAQEPAGKQVVMTYTGRWGPWAMQ